MFEQKKLTPFGGQLNAQKFHQPRKNEPTMARLNHHISEAALPPLLGVYILDSTFGEKGRLIPICSSYPDDIQDRYNN